MNDRTNTKAEPYTELIDRVRQVSLLRATGSLLGWDQETMMPPRGLPMRSRQLAQLARLSHAMFTDPRIGELLAACELDTALTADPAGDAAANLRELRHQYDRATSLPPTLVQELAETQSLARAAWVEARRGKDYERFRPWLEKIVALKREEARCYRHGEGDLWDALADGYEPGLTAAEVERVFTPLRAQLAELVATLTERGRAPSDAFIRLRLPIDRQERFVRSVCQAMGFDFERGRLDTSAHPFCAGMHCHDVRMTTRFSEDNLPDALSSTMHEAGHGLYEQGLPEAHVGTPLGRAAGLSIHESQSRLWENHVGRSRAFWRWCYPKLAEAFGDAVAGLDFETVYGGANLVRPTLIRVESDEVTYHLHILIRFELERALLSGELSVADLPGAWNERYKAYLGLDVPDDAAGCMQDVHWSVGSIGYFPTYTLGTLYAAQFYGAAEAALGDLDGMLARGEFGPLKAWLNEHVHAHGRRYRAAALCERVTGRTLSAEPFIAHLRRKLERLYGL